MIDGRKCYPVSPLTLSIRKSSNLDVHRVGTGILRGKGRSMSLERNAHKDAGFKEILMVLPQTWQ